jgi:hypothetical protein
MTTLIVPSPALSPSRFFAQIDELLLHLFMDSTNRPRWRRHAPSPPYSECPHTVSWRSSLGR